MLQRRQPKADGPLQVGARPVVGRGGQALLHPAQEQPREGVLPGPVPQVPGDRRLVPELGAVEPGGGHRLQGRQVQPFHSALPGKPDAHDVLRPVVGQGGGQGGGGVGAGHVGLQDAVAAAGQRHEFLLHSAVVPDRDPQAALVPQLVEAPPLGAAGVGPEGLSRPPEARPGVDVPEGQIGQARSGDLLRPDGAVAPPALHIPVEDPQVEPSVRRGDKARQG